MIQQPRPFSDSTAGRLGLAAVLLLLNAAGAGAGEYRILTDQSVFGIVTHKGGFAGGLAHDHFVVAGKHAPSLHFDESEPLAIRFELLCAVEDLVVDSPELRERWYPRLAALGILEDPFKEVSAEDREKIRRTMLSEKQLDTEAFPRISARVENAIAEGQKMGTVELDYRAVLRLEVHGQAFEAPVAGRYELDGETLRIEAAGQFRFRDFGIKPYSAMLGAIKNKDEFHVYASLVAVRVAESGGGRDGNVE